MKTGYISASGFNLIASAKRNNQRIIAVVFGGRSGKSRNAHMKTLLDKGFRDVGKVLVASARNVPLPPRKPVMAVALASLNNLSPTSGGEMIQKSTDAISSLNTNLQNGMFKRLIGEGDYDQDVSDRLETGLIAIAAHKGEAYKPQNTMGSLAPTKKMKTATLANPGIRSINQYWAIQIGAFTSRAKTDQAIGKALNTLPTSLTRVNPIIVPTRKGENWLFRARLNGYNKEQAMAACQYLSPCIPVEPQSLARR